MAKVGIIGGSGLYQIEGIKKVKEVAVKTPFGAPSDKYITGELEGIPVSLLRVPSQIQVKHILCAATPQFRNWERNAIMKSQNCIIPVLLHAFVESVLPSFAMRSVASGSRRFDEATNLNRLCSEAD